MERTRVELKMNMARLNALVKYWFEVSAVFIIAIRYYEPISNRYL